MEEKVDEVLAVIEAGVSRASVLRVLQRTRSVEEAINILLDGEPGEDEEPASNHYNKEEEEEEYDRRENMGAYQPQREETSRCPLQDEPLWSKHDSSVIALDESDLDDSFLVRELFGPPKKGVSSPPRPPPSQSQHPARSKSSSHLPSSHKGSSYTRDIDDDIVIIEDTPSPRPKRQSLFIPPSPSSSPSLMSLRDNHELSLPKSLSHLRNASQNSLDDVPDPFSPQNDDFKLYSKSPIRFEMLSPVFPEDEEGRRFGALVSNSPIHRSSTPSQLNYSPHPHLLDEDLAANGDSDEIEVEECSTFRGSKVKPSQYLPASLFPEESEEEVVYSPETYIPSSDEDDGASKKKGDDLGYEASQEGSTNKRRKLSDDERRKREDAIDKQKAKSMAQEERLAKRAKREQEKLEKQAEREKKKKEKEDEKERKKQESMLKMKERMAANPRNLVKNVLVVIDPSIIEGPHGDLLRFVKNLGYDVQLRAHHSGYKGVVSWTTRPRGGGLDGPDAVLPAGFDTDLELGVEEESLLKSKLEEHFIVLFSPVLLARLAVDKAALSREMRSIKRISPSGKIILLIEGLQKQIRQQKTSTNQALRAHMRGTQPLPPMTTSSSSTSSSSSSSTLPPTIPKLSDMDYEHVLVWLQMESDLKIHLTESVSETIEFICNATKAVLPNLRQGAMDSSLPFCVSSSRHPVKVNLETKEGLSALWQAHIRQVVGVSDAKAEAIAHAHPSPHALVRVFQQRGRHAVASCAVRRGEASRSVGPKVSETLFRYYTTFEGGMVFE